MSIVSSYFLQLGVDILICDIVVHPEMTCAVDRTLKCITVSTLLLYYSNCALSTEIIITSNYVTITATLSETSTSMDKHVNR